MIESRHQKDKQTRGGQCALGTLPVLHLEFMIIGLFVACTKFDETSLYYVSLEQTSLEQVYVYEMSLEYMSGNQRLDLAIIGKLNTGQRLGLTQVSGQTSQ